MSRSICFVLAALLSALTLPALSAEERRDLPHNTIPYHDFWGKFKGVTDLKGRTILPAKFANITYQGNEIFAADQIDQKNPEKWNKRLLFNRYGRRIRYKVPAKTELIEIYSLGRRYDSELGKAIHSLPHESLLLFLNEQKDARGLCYPDGTIFLPAQKNAVICYLKPGFGYISNGAYNPGTPDKIIDLETGKSVDSDAKSAPAQATTRLTYQSDRYLHPEYRHSYTPRMVPKLKSPPNITFEKISERDLLKTVNPDDGKFSPRLWRNQKIVKRKVLFERLLREYDLIGMSTDKVLELMGSSGNALYGDGVAWDNYRGDLRTLIQSFGGGGCMPQSALHFQINFKNDRVVSWHFLNGLWGRSNSESPPITANVLIPSWDENPFLSREENMIGARIGNPITNWYPEVVAKYH